MVRKNVKTKRIDLSIFLPTAYLFLREAYYARCHNAHY